MMTTFRVRLIGLAAAMITVGCGWKGPGTILLRDGSSIRCPNVYVTNEYVSCVGMEGGEEVYPIDTVKNVLYPSDSQMAG